MSSTTKKIVTGDYIDEATGLRFVEDVEGVLHCVMDMGGTSSEININIPEIKIPQIPAAQVHVDVTPSNPDINVVINNNETLENLAKRYKRILEKLRMENNWLWEIVEVAIRDGKKKNGAVAAINALEKAVKDRTA